jgi:gas vesicle protein
MNRHPRENHYPGFLLGLVTGAALGAGLAMYFAPKIGSEIRNRVTDSNAKDLGDTASEHYGRVATRVADAVEELTSRGQKARDATADVVVRAAHEVARSAHEVERFADRAAEAAGKH